MGNIKYFCTFSNITHFMWLYLHLLKLMKVNHYGNRMLKVTSSEEVSVIQEIILVVFFIFYAIKV